MTDTHASSVALLRLLAEIVRKLQPEELQQLLDNQAKLAFLPPGATITLPAMDVGQVRAGLAEAVDRGAAVAYLAGLKLKKSELLVLGQQLDVAVSGKDTISVIRRKIADSTAGVRDDARAIRSS